MTADVLPLVKPDVQISRIRLSIERWGSYEYSFKIDKTEVTEFLIEAFAFASLVFPLATTL